MGYILTGLDVFVWILLTAGTMLVPVIVLTICCIKKHFENERRLTRLFMLKEQKNSGIIGPFSSQENLEYSRNEKSGLPASIIINSAIGNVLGGGGENPGGAGASHLDTPTLNEKNKVRFKDDGSNSNQPRRMNQYNNVLIPSTSNNNADAPASGSETLRGLRDAVNYFVPRPKPSAKQPSNTNSSLLPNLALNSDNTASNPNQTQAPLPSLQYEPYVNPSDVSNISGSYRLPSLIMNQNNRTNLNAQNIPQKEPVYSISSSYRLPINNDQNTNVNSNERPTQRAKNDSIENIYSQVISTNAKNRNEQQNQISSDIDDQPLYMNTPYSIQNKETQPGGAIQQPPIPPNPNQRYGSWNDSSV